MQQPPSYRCSMCNINYPAYRSKCDVCGEPCTHGVNGPVDHDWRTKVEAAKAEQAQAHVLSEDESIAAWRLLSLLDAGYSFVDAELLALEHTVDLHQATDLLKNGCTAETAMSILL